MGVLYPAPQSLLALAVTSQAEQQSLGEALTQLSLQVAFETQQYGVDVDSFFSGSDPADTGDGRLEFAVSGADPVALERAVGRIFFFAFALDLFLRSPIVWAGRHSS